jgi:hypothetical protein
MSSTKRSESANHVLKVYVPCRSSINMFVRQYTKLIDDREKADDEAEKNRSQVSAVIWRQTHDCLLSCLLTLIVLLAENFKLSLCLVTQLRSTLPNYIPQQFSNC